MNKGLAVVTGASSGIGWEMAKQLAARGYDLLLVARREERLTELAGQIRSQWPVQANMLRLDLTDRAERRKLIAKIDPERDRFCLMVNNAGFGAARAAVDIGSDRSLEMIELNVRALTELSLEAAKVFLQKGCGGIINVASTAAFQPVPYLNVYSATKAYVLSFTEALAEELRGTGVRVMALCPGYTKTEFQQVAGERADGARMRHMMSPADCVRIGLRGFDAGKRICVTGVSNQLHTLAGRFFPRSIVVRSAAVLVKGRTR